MKRLAVFLGLTLGALPAQGAEIDVVASFSILGDLVREVGGDRVATTTIVGADADSHVYDPRPSDAAALAKADAFVINGLGFEGWMERLVDATGYRGPIVVAAADIPKRKAAEEEGHEEHDHKEHDHEAHDHGEFDPHGWQNLQNGQRYVAAIAQGLCAADAAGCATYQANAAAYSERLLALDADIRARLAALPAEKRLVITSHDAFGYFGDAYGVRFLAPVTVSTDDEPSAGEVAALIEQIRTEGVTALFVENMTDARLIEQIARETNATIGGTLYADALSGADGPAPTYFDMIRHNADLLIAAMDGKS